MNPFTASPGAAQMMARQTIQDRIDDAGRHAQVREARAARRAERGADRPAHVSGSSPQRTSRWSRWVVNTLRPAV